MITELEHKIEDDVVLYAKRAGWTIFKLNLQGNRGWPDRLFISKGPVYVFIEFKRPGERLRKLQVHRAATLESMGCIVGKADTVEEGVALLDGAAK